MSDWTTARVVRDRDGDLWGRGERDWWQMLGTDTEIDDEGLAGYDPTPVLDADGLPVVRTVGDLTARHVGRRVRVGEVVEGKMMLLVVSPDSRVRVMLWADGTLTESERPIGTPCEVLS